MWLAVAGHDAVHTLDLADGNRTTDEQVIERAILEQRVVISKDADFVNSHLLTGRPEKILVISTGNISNRELERLFVPLISQLVTLFRTHSFLELGKTGIAIRG